MGLTPIVLPSVPVLLLAAGCWQMQDVSQWGADGIDTTTEIGETDGITDPDTWNNGTWIWDEMASPTTNDLAAVWGSAYDNVYAVGKDGVIVRFDGGEWSLVEYEAQAKHNLHAIAGHSATQIWAVGAERFVLGFDGEQWQEQQTVFLPPEDPGGYRGVCAGSADAAFAVGEFATVTMYQTGGWTYGLDSPLDVDFHAVACVNDSEAFIAGHNHASFSSSVLLRHPAQSGVISMPHEISDNMYGIAMDQEGNAWAVGFDDGVGSKLYQMLLGGGWTVQTTSPHELLGLWAHTAGGVWAVGNTTDEQTAGVVQGWLGGEVIFELEYSGTTRLRGTWSSVDNDERYVFAVGKGGAIIHVHWEPN